MLMKNIRHPEASALIMQPIIDPIMRNRIFEYISQLYIAYFNQINIVIFQKKHHIVFQKTSYSFFKNTMMF